MHVNQQRIHTTLIGITMPVLLQTWNLSARFHEFLFHRVRHMSMRISSQMLRGTRQARRVATIKSKLNGARHLLERHASSICQERPSYTRNRRHFCTGWNLHAHFERDQHMPSPISHKWSTPAIAGFFLTSSSQLSNGLGKLGGLKKRRNKSQTSQIHKNDVALP